MKSILKFALCGALVLIVIMAGCNNDQPADDATGVKSATLPANIAPFESLAGTAVDAKAFDNFGNLFEPRDAEEAWYIAEGVYFVKMKVTGVNNGKMANFLVFEENPAPGMLTVQTKINGNKCFSYAFDAEWFALQAFWADNGVSVRYEFERKAVTLDADITPRTVNDPDNMTAPVHGDNE